MSFQPSLLSLAIASVLSVQAGTVVADDLAAQNKKLR